jgi:hypothetical protein
MQVMRLMSKKFPFGASVLTKNGPISTFRSKILREIVPKRAGFRGCLPNLGRKIACVTCDTRQTRRNKTTHPRRTNSGTSPTGRVRVSIIHRFDRQHHGFDWNSLGRGRSHCGGLRLCFELLSFRSRRCWQQGAADFWSLCTHPCAHYWYSSCAFFWLLGSNHSPVLAVVIISLFSHYERLVACFLGFLSSFIFLALAMLIAWFFSLWLAFLAYTFSGTAAATTFVKLAPSVPGEYYYLAPPSTS